MFLKCVFVPILSNHEKPIPKDDGICTIFSIRQPKPWDCPYLLGQQPVKHGSKIHTNSLHICKECSRLCIYSYIPLDTYSPVKILHYILHSSVVIYLVKHKRNTLSQTSCRTATIICLERILKVSDFAWKLKGKASILQSNTTHPVISRLVLLCHSLIFGFELWIHIGPPSAQLLGYVTHSKFWVHSLHFAALIIAEPEERRPIKQPIC
ncbi:hypothetical protein C0J52_00950 [Blattella germanica]|nr:hypothetical protein C0J52_00950 [Blattella germanica]